LAIKAITFDFWQTLYKNKPVDYDERLRRLKTDIEAGNGRVVEPVRLEAAVKVARDTWNRAWVEDYRTMMADEWLAIVLQYLGISLQPDHLLDMQTRLENSVLSDMPILVQEVHTVLAGLSQRYRLGIISDTGLTPGRVLRQILETDSLAGYFSHLTFSDEIGYSKPHPQAFLTTLKALGAGPAEAVHIGDLLRTDIAGAKGVGMRGVQYIGVDYDRQSGTDVTPDAIIRNHTELELLLQQW
jgi:putative hydrolase of the HAD superfamily